jgi:predicted PurR-regulated permease PerM
MRWDRPVVFWLVAGLLLVGLVALLRDALLPFALAAAIAYFLNPITNVLQRIGLGRTLASLLVVACMATTLAAVLFFLLPLLVGQMRQLAQSLPGDLARLQSGLEAWGAAHLGDSFPAFKAGLTELAQSSSNMIGGFAQGLWSRGLAVVNLISLVLVTPVVAFYLLRDWGKMLGRIDGWLPRAHADTIRRLAGDVDTAVSAFVRGQGTICLILAILYAAALTAIGLSYGLVIGLATGLLAFIPMVGWALGLVLALVIAIAQAWPDTTLPLMVLGIYGAGMALDAAVLSPSIVGQRVGLHPVWLMLALFAFSALFGFLGVLVAVPVAAAIAVLVRFARDRYLASEIYHGGLPPPPQSPPTPATVG